MAHRLNLQSEFETLLGIQEVNFQPPESIKLKYPDNTMAEDILAHFKFCRFVRRYVVDNLYHDILELYY